MIRLYDGYLLPISFILLACSDSKRHPDDAMLLAISHQVSLPVQPQGCVEHLPGVIFASCMHSREARVTQLCEKVYVREDPDRSM